MTRIHRSSRRHRSRRKHLTTKIPSIAVLIVLGACSNDDAKVTQAGTDHDAAHVAAGEDAAGAWQPLLTQAWQLDAGTEKHFCVRQTTSEDIWIHGVRGLSPTGTHHSLIGYYRQPDAGALPPDGAVECDGFAIGDVLLLGTGLGSKVVEFPDGIAARIPAGSQMILNLHVFNAGDTSLSGTSGVEISRADPAKVAHEAGFVLAGKIPLDITPGQTTQTGTCTLPADVTILAYGPHMHKLGTHMLTRIVPASGTPTTLMDRDYRFEDQSLDVLSPPISLKKGDALEVNCTYDNPGTKTITWGQSSNDEMCYTLMYWYPAGVPAGGVCTR